MLALCLIGCGNEHNSYREVAYRQYLIEQFHTMDAVSVPGTHWNWLVRLPNGEVWYVYMVTTTNGPEVQNKMIVFPTK